MLKSVARRISKVGASGLWERRARFSSTGGGDRRRLEGKVALITGGASGLGLATAREFLREGARVIIADLAPQLASLDPSTELGPDAHLVECDVAVEQQVSDAVDLAVARHGRLDVMHNNAGITGRQLPPGIADLDISEFDRVMSTNLRGAVLGIKHAARVMGPRGSGSILCTGSVSGLVGGLGSHPYSVSKSAVAGLVKSAAGELCRRGIRVNCISPSGICTPMVLEQLGEFYPLVGEEGLREIVRGWGELEGASCEEVDVAKAAVFLASDEAKYVTGHNLVVDGGFTCFKRLNMPTPDQVV